MNEGSLSSCGMCLDTHKRVFNEGNPFLSHIVWVCSCAQPYVCVLCMCVYVCE